MEEMKPFVELKNVSISFPGVKVLDDLSIKFYKGKVHVLLGENGAGKSTIIKIIAGVYKRDCGDVFVDGKLVNFSNTSDSLKAGISIIHQELSVIPDLTVAENIFLGREPKSKSGLIDYKKMNNDAQQLIDSMGIKIDAKKTIRSLPNGDRQMVEIIRAVSQNSSLVIMDEPTSSLSDNEVDSLFKIIDKLKSNNVGIIYISHRLKEIKAIGDYVTILRDGAVIDTLKVSEVSEAEMVNKMVGRTMTTYYYKAENALDKNTVVLDVKNLSRKGVFDNISFDLHKGEILGVAGLVGAGRTEVMRAVFGADRIDYGSIQVNGKTVVIKSPGDAVKLGLGLIPEDRRNQGLFLEKSVKENNSIVALYRNSNHGFIDFDWEKNSADLYIEKVRVKTPSKDAIIKNLSGGNQQKVVISKWLLVNTQILIMDEPTRGIDVNAKAEIYGLMKEFVEKGGSIIMVSSELPEVLGVSDRVMVMREGHIAGFLDRDQATEQSIMKLASLSK